MPSPRLIARVTCWTLIVLGFGAWFSWRLVRVEGEYPLGVPEGITVDSRGGIYVGLQFYHRVQKYDNHGTFLTGWSIPTSGSFRLRVNASDELEVVAARGNELFRYSPAGELLWRRSYATETLYEEFGEEGESRCEAPDGSALLIVGSYLFPTIVRLLPTGERRTLIRMPWYKWVVMGPLPAWLWGVLGILIGSLGSRIVSNRKHS